MELEEIKPDEQWTSGVYSVKLGRMGAKKADVYHVYKSGKYVAQRESLAGCKDWIADDIEESKK